MQLKLRRSQRDSGIVSKSIVFCLDARAEYSPEEIEHIHRYKLTGQVIYNSEASKRLLEKGEMHNDGSMSGGLKAIGIFALAATRLNITVASLSKGQHIECKSMEELLAAEEALIEACQNLKSYLQTAASFDGREVVLDFSSDRPEVVASATGGVLAPAPASPPPPTPSLPPPVLPEPAIEHEQGGGAGEDYAYERGGGYTSSGSGLDIFADMRRLWNELEGGGRTVAAIVLILFLLVLIKACQ